MAEKTLQEVFGAGATQTLTTITISKNDLANLVATSNNNADSLSVGLLNRLVSAYPATARQADKDVSLNANLSLIPSVEGDFAAIPNVAYEVRNYQIGVYKLFPSGTPSPNDY